MIRINFLNKHQLDHHARDRSKQIVDFNTGSGAMTKTILIANLKPIADSYVLLGSDSNPAIQFIN